MDVLSIAAIETSSPRKSFPHVRPLKQLYDLDKNEYEMIRISITARLFVECSQYPCFLFTPMIQMYMIIDNLGRHNEVFRLSQ